MRRNLFLLTLVLWSLPAAAQPDGDVQPVQLSVGAGGVTSFIGNGGDARIMVSIPHSDRRAIEGFVGGYGGTDPVDTKAVFGVQVRNRIRSDRPRTVDPFWTWGFMGAVVSYDTSSCVNRHCTTERKTAVMPPALFVVGGGLDYRVKPHLAVRFDYQAGVFLVVPIGARAGVSLSVPLGRVAAED